ncbi:MAG: hypothetical protein ABGZ35_00015 [Planctomycetaceae bacterium]
MTGDWHTTSPSGGGYADVTVWQHLFFNCSPDSFPKSLIATSSFGDDLIELVRLLPQSELSLGNPLRNVLASFSESREFKVVNNAGTVGGKTRNQVILDQFNKKPRKSKFDRVATDHRNDRPAVLSCASNGVDNLSKL